MILADDLNWKEKNDCYRFLVVFSLTFSNKIFYNLKMLPDVIQHLSWCITNNRIINTNKCWTFSKTSHELLSEIKQISILWKKIFFSLLMLLSHFNLWSCWFMWIYCINMYQFNYLVEVTISKLHLFQGL